MQNGKKISKVIEVCISGGGRSEELILLTLITTIYFQDLEVPFEGFGPH
jgi:hypothetical protein